MGETIEKSTFSLPNKKVTIKFINRKRGMASGSWVTADHAISGGMLTTATKKIPAPLQKNGSIANVLTTEEKELLEGPEGLNMNLSVYSNKEFWQNRYVILRKGDNILDLSDPIDYIDYKILLGNPSLVAPSWEAKDGKLTYWFAIVEEGEESKLTRKAFNYKKEAFKLYSTIEDSADTLKGIVKLINKKPISDSTKIEWLQGEVEKIIENTPEKFVSLLKDSNYETKILLSHAVDKGVVIVQNHRYMTSDGIELAEEGELASFDNAIRYLSKPTNNELVDILKVKIKKTK